MQIKTIVEKDDKTVEFSAVLTEEQHAYLINFAITTLMMRGIIPLTTDDVEFTAEGTLN